MWRGKKSGTELKNIPRRSAPLQHISSGSVVSVESEVKPVAGAEQSKPDDGADAKQTSSEDGASEKQKTVGSPESKPESAPVPASDSVKNSDVQTAPGGETKTEAKTDVELKDNK